MSKLIKTNKYLDYPINTKYSISKLNMKEVYLSLVHARDTIDRPIALRYTVGLDNNHSFDICKLTRKIKSIFKSNYTFIYSFEYAEQQKGLHLEMILVVNQSIYNPLTVFNILRKIFFNLHGVMIRNEDKYRKVSLNFHERKEEYLSIAGGSKVGHNLKNEEQFIDCIYRASYLAKQNDKELVQYKKTFGTIKG